MPTDSCSGLRPSTTIAVGSKSITQRPAKTALFRHTPAALLSAVAIFWASDIALARGEGEAIPGTPFGVGQVTVPLSEADAAVAWDLDGLAIQEANGRALYPVLTAGRLRKLLGELLGGGNQGPPDSVVALFLFTGEAPLELTLYTPSARRLRVTPAAPRDPRAHGRLLQRWWREYHAVAREQIQQGDYPPIVQTYLTSMLARRLGLTPPLLSRITQPEPSEPQKTLELLLGVESLRLATLRRTNSAAELAQEAADRPVPDDIVWTPRAAPAGDAEVEIEPLALRVPQECCYIRFGSFENYTWYNRLQKDYGELSAMITLRGLDPQVNRRMQKQLCLRESALAEMMGPTVISDVALIGRDLYLRDGAAIGVLLKARNALLGVDLNKQRASWLAEEKDRGATQTTEKIAGRDVAFISTPDNRLRSFYVVDGDYHLVTTSRALAQRFLEIRDGTGSLGQSGEFRHARSLLPTRREDTIFVYFSSAFLQGLVSPQYQIELPRRLRAATDLELLLLATHAAQAEHRPAATIADLIRGGQLPPGFDRRPDGSGPILAKQEVLDSLRGTRGSFLPIPDVDLRGVTAAEEASLAEKATYYSNNWKQLDPLLVGVKRFGLEGEGRERVVIDAYVAPFAEQKYGWIVSLLGAPTRVRIRPAAGDVISVQAAVKGGLLSPSMPPHQLFLGVQDAPPLAETQTKGLLQTLKMLRSTPGYLGAWPKSGFLDWLPLQLGAGEVDANGFSRLPFDVWRRQWEDFSALSFDPQLLARVTPQLKPQEVESEAQVRVQVADLSQAQLQTWVNSLTYARAQQASLGNARLMHALSQQLGVPREAARAVAENVLDAKLVCPLGGEYRLEERPGRIALWTSTNWSAGGAQRPAEYQTPLLTWFRGLDSELTKYGDRVVLHTAVDMQRRPQESKPQLPKFDLNFFGGKKDTAAPGKKVPPPPPTPPPADVLPSPRQP